MRIADGSLVDKTELLEREIVQFPSLYIEGAAVSGKSVAIQMMLKKHPEVISKVFFMEEELKYPSEWMDKMRYLQKQRTLLTDNKSMWVVFENVCQVDSEEILETIADYILHMPESDRAILSGRERQQKNF